MEEVRSVATSADWIISSGDGDYAFFRQMLETLPRRAGARVGVRHAGSQYRARPQFYNQLDPALGVRARFVAADLYRFCADDPISVPYYQTHGGVAVGEKPAGRLRVSHSPTNRFKKGTDEILAALRDLDIDLDVIEGVPFDECVRRRAPSHIFVDQAQAQIGGFGASSIEALAAGCVTISDMRHIHPRVWAEFIPKPPILDVRAVVEIRQAVQEFLADREVVAVHAAHAVAWTRAHSDPVPVANYWRKHLERLA
jgi:hypothetical protein